jgi:hypothetical protein
MAPHGSIISFNGFPVSFEKRTVTMATEYDVRRPVASVKQ